MYIIIIWDLGVYQSLSVKQFILKALRKIVADDIPFFFLL